jgi:hypothetical protein
VVRFEILKEWLGGRRSGGGNAVVGWFRWETDAAAPDPADASQPPPTQPTARPAAREEEDVNRRLDRKMTDAFAQIWKIHKEKAVPVRGGEI